MTLLANSERSRLRTDKSRCTPWRVWGVVCVSQCPVGALSLVREPARGEPLEIRELLERATASA